MKCRIKLKYDIQVQLKTIFSISHLLFQWSLLFDKGKKNFHTMAKKKLDKNKTEAKMCRPYVVYDMM